MIWLLVFFIAVRPAGLLDSAQKNALHHHDITVTVTNIKTNKGKMVVSVYDNRKSFPHYLKEYRMLVTEVTSSTVSCTFKGLPDGEYAVALFHDVNMDGKCNTNLIGYPTEGFGFSNNVRPVFSAPSFDDCKLLLNQDLSVTVKLIH